MPKSTIGELESSPYHPIYRRPDGTIWMKLCDTRHAPAEKNGDMFDVVGSVIDFDPDEKVEVLHFANERMA